MTEYPKSVKAFSSYVSAKKKSVYESFGQLGNIQTCASTGLVVNQCAVAMLTKIIRVTPGIKYGAFGGYIPRQLDIACSHRHETDFHWNRYCLQSVYCRSVPGRELQPVP